MHFMDFPGMGINGFGDMDISYSNGLLAQGTVDPIDLGPFKLTGAGKNKRPGFADLFQSTAEQAHNRRAQQGNPENEKRSFGQLNEESAFSFVSGQRQDNSNELGNQYDDEKRARRAEIGQERLCVFVDWLGCDGQAGAPSG